MDPVGGGSLARLLGETAEAHHRAFISTDGADPDWPAWYAKHLLDHGFERFTTDSTLSARALADLLTAADRKYRSDGAPEPWEDYYARILLEGLPGGV